MASASGGNNLNAYAAAGRSLGFLALKGVNEDELWRSAGTGIPDISVGVGKPLIAMLYPNFRGNDHAHAASMQHWRGEHPDRSGALRHDGGT
jgi:hypothetical protein